MIDWCNQRKLGIIQPHAVVYHSLSSAVDILAKLLPPWQVESVPSAGFWYKYLFCLFDNKMAPEMVLSFGSVGHTRHLRKLICASYAY